MRTGSGATPTSSCSSWTEGEPGADVLCEPRCGFRDAIRKEPEPPPLSGAARHPVPHRREVGGKPGRQDVIGEQVHRAPPGLLPKATAFRRVTDQAFQGRGHL